MVKIRDLTNRQIIDQLTKYFKFIAALDSERKKRIKKGASEKDLYTKEEIEAKKIAKVNKVTHPNRKNHSSSPAVESTSIFHFKIDDEQLEEISENAKKSKVQQEDQMSVSRLIKTETIKSQKGLKEFESGPERSKLNLERSSKVKKKKL